MQLEVEDTFTTSGGLRRNIRSTPQSHKFKKFNSKSRKMNYIQNCAVNRVATFQNQDDWAAIRKLPSFQVKKMVHRRYPQAMRKRGRHGLGRLPPRKWRKLNCGGRKEGNGHFIVPATKVETNIPKTPGPAFRRPNITLEAWGNLDVNERLMYHQYPKTVRDVLLLPNIYKETDCPPGTYLQIWSDGQVKSLLLDGGKLGQSKAHIMKYLEPLETLTKTKVEQYINTHTKNRCMMCTILRHTVLWLIQCTAQWMNFTTGWWMR